MPDSFLYFVCDVCKENDELKDVNYEK